MWAVVVVFVFVGGVRCGCSFLSVWLGSARGCGLRSFCSVWSSSLAFSRSFSSCRRSSSVAVPACSACVASSSSCWLLRVVAFLGSFLGVAFFVGSSSCWLPSLVCSPLLSLFCRVLPLVLRVRLLRGAFLCVEGRGLACANGPRGLRRGGSHATFAGVATLMRFRYVLRSCKKNKHGIEQKNKHGAAFATSAGG